MTEAWRGTIEPESVEVTQLERGRLFIDRSAVDFGAVRVVSGGCSVGYKGHSDLVAGRSVLGVIAGQRTDARWFGERIDAGDIVQCHTSMDLSTLGPSKLYYVAVDTTKLEPNDGRRFHRSPLYAERLRRCLQTALERPNPRVEEAILSLLALSFSEKSAFSGSRSFIRRVAAVRQCEEYMREHIVENPTLSQLSAVSGLRMRSLINAFHAVIGMSPMTYLRVQRLNEVHRALLELDPRKTRVIDVASTWGFWHMGHFTESYRAIFGENPSATLNRKKQLSPT